MASNTKSALLDSAERAARARGFDGFSYADLATDVGIRKASVHHHFPTKADLSVALMSRYRETIEAALIAVDAKDLPAAERLAALITIYEDATYGGQSLCLCVALSISRDTLTDAAIAEIMQFREMVTTWLVDVFQAAKNDGSIRDVDAPELEATAVLPLLEGAQLAARAAEDISVFQTATAMLQQRIRTTS